MESTKEAEKRKTLTKLEQYAQIQTNKQKNATCKNGNFSFKIKEDKKNVLNSTFDIKNDGCKNERRNGSAYCQECSNQHKS